MILDAAAAIIAFVPLRVGADLMSGKPAIGAAVTAGLIAPLLMRTKLRVPFSKDRAAVNAVAMLRRLQVDIRIEIEDCCATCETAWIIDKVLTCIEDIDPSEVEAWAIEYVSAKFRGAAAEATCESLKNDIMQAALDGSSDSDRKHLIIQILLGHRGRRSVVALMRRGKRRRRDLPVASLADSAGVIMAAPVIEPNGPRAVEGGRPALDSSSLAVEGVDIQDEESDESPGNNV